MLSVDCRQTISGILALGRGAFLYVHASVCVHGCMVFFALFYVCMDAWWFFALFVCAWMHGGFLRFFVCAWMHGGFLRFFVCARVCMCAWMHGVFCARLYV